jgi:superfamily II DNA or RNA helicase
MNIKVGLGKTLIVLTYLIRRKLNDIKYIIYTMPKSAFGSVIEEITSLGFNVNVYGNSKFIDKKWKESLENTGNNQVNVYSYKNNLKLKEGAINIIEHDGLRKYKETLLNIISDSIFIIDEVHKCLPKGTKRSSTALEVSKLALETIAFTGTPIINSQGAKLLINWLESNVDFNVNIDNFGVATNSMVSYSVKTDIEVINIDKVCKFKNKEQIKYDNFLKKNNLNGMISVCDKACTRKMIKLVVKKYKKKIKVFLVAKNKNHQVYLANKLINKISGSKIVCIGINSKLNDNCDFLPHINLTDKSVTNGNIDYDIVITRQNFSTGYNLTRMTCMITSVYFSSEPTREQLRGRINRLDQNNPKIEYITVIIGILKLVHNNYEKVKLISRCLQSKEISNKDLIQLKKLF